MKKKLLILFMLLPLTGIFATTIDEVDKVCAICGEHSIQIEVMSTNTMGSPDLDLRPAEMQRSTIVYWVEECPHCGYCSKDISEYVDGAEEVMDREEYRRRLEDQNFPHLANQFLCMMQINEAAGETRLAVYNSICAAWACDDEENSPAARECRLVTIGRIEAIVQEGELYMEQPGGDYILLCELTRRIGDFTKAEKYAEAGLKNNPEDVIRQILEYERKLIATKDTATHTVDDALN